MNDGLTEKYQEHGKIKKKIISMLLLVVNIALIPVAFQLSLLYYETTDYTFSDNVGYISQHSYDQYVETPNTTIAFDDEIPIKIDTVLINDVRYEAVFSDSDIFNVGMPTEEYYRPLFNFYEFDFLFGGAFINNNQIVLTKSVSIDMFDHINSVGETITIGDIEYVVSGVVDEPNVNMQYIFFSEDNIELISDDEWIFHEYIVFKDDDVQMKLYERGGFDLVRITRTKINQQSITFTTKIIVIILNIIVSIVSLSFKSKENEDLLVKKPKTSSRYHFVKALLKSFLWITEILAFFILITICFMSIGTTIPVAFLFIKDQIPRFYWLLSIYAVPVIYLMIKKIKHVNKSKVDH